MNSVIRGQLQISVETNGSLTGHKDINVDATGLIECTGVLDFQSFTATWQTGTATASTVRFAGRINCASLGNMASGQPFALTDYNAMKKALNPEVQPAPILYDSFTAADGTAMDAAKWTVTTGGAVAAAVTTNSNRARFTTGATGGYSANDRVYMAATAPASLADVEILVRHTFGTFTSETYAYYLLRADTTSPVAGTKYEAIFTAANLIMSKLVSGVQTVFTQPNWGTLGLANPAVGTVRWLRFRVKGTTVAAKVWDDGTPEPLAWTYSTTDSSISGGGSVVAVGTGGNAAASIVNYIDQFHIYAL